MKEKIEITVDYETEAIRNGFGQAVRNVTYTITHDGETVFSETMSERMFREAHTPVRDFHRWLSDEEKTKEDLIHLPSMTVSDAEPVLQPRQRRLLHLLRSAPQWLSQLILRFAVWRNNRKTCVLMLDPLYSDSHDLQSMLQIMRRAKRRGRKVEVQCIAQPLSSLPRECQVSPEDREELSLRRTAVSEILSEPGVNLSWF